MESDLKILLQTNLGLPLPGADSHRSMMSYVRQTAQEVRESSQGYREGAVMIVLHRHQEQWHTLLIERPEYDGVHSRQIAFPGGKKDPSDPDLLFTAIRETQEEVGIHPSAYEIIGQLSEVFIPPSNFVVRPYIAFCDTIPPLIPDPREVASVFSWNLNDLLSPQAVSRERVNVTGGLELEVNAFKAGEHIIWGATAMILAELRDVLRRR